MNDSKEFEEKFEYDIFLKFSDWNKIDILELEKIIPNIENFNLRNFKNQYNIKITILNERIKISSTEDAIEVLEKINYFLKSTNINIEDMRQYSVEIFKSIFMNNKINRKLLCKLWKGKVITSGFFMKSAYSNVMAIHTPC